VCQRSVGLCWGWRVKGKGYLVSKDPVALEQELYRLFITMQPSGSGVISSKFLEGPDKRPPWLWDKNKVRLLILSSIPTIWTVMLVLSQYLICSLKKLSEHDIRSTRLHGHTQSEAPVPRLLGLCSLSGLSLFNHSPNTLLHLLWQAPCYLLSGIPMTSTQPITSPPSISHMAYPPIFSSL
jgi:hypothetical protein